MSTIPPGWYKDPVDPTIQRWWDGEGWLGEPIPADATPPEGPPKVTAGLGNGGLEASPADSTARNGAADTDAPAGSGTSTAAHPSTLQAPPGWQGGHRHTNAPLRPQGLMLAGLGARVMARIVDILVVAVLATLANVWFLIEFWRSFRPVLEWALNQPPGTVSFEGVPGTAERASSMLLLMTLVLTAVWFAYEVPASANSGQTLGKRLFGIKVVRLDSDERLGFGRSFRRWFRMGWPTLFWTLCWGLLAILQVIDCLFAFFDRRLRQALHDRIALTAVVQVPRPGRPETAPTAAPPLETIMGGRNADPR